MDSDRIESSSYSEFHRYVNSTAVSLVSLVDLARSLAMTGLSILCIKAFSLSFRGFLVSLVTLNRSFATRGVFTAKYVTEASTATKATIITAMMQYVRQLSERHEIQGYITRNFVEARKTLEKFPADRKEASKGSSRF